MLSVASPFSYCTSLRLHSLRLHTSSFLTHSTLPSLRPFCVAVAPVPIRSSCPTLFCPHPDHIPTRQCSYKCEQGQAQRTRFGFQGPSDGYEPVSQGAMRLVCRFSRRQYSTFGGVPTPRQNSSSVGNLAFVQTYAQPSGVVQNALGKSIHDFTSDCNSACDSVHGGSKGSM